MDMEEERPTHPPNAGPPAEVTPNSDQPVEFRTSPEKYHHWHLLVDGRVATLLMDVDETAPLVEGYELKLNSYDLQVDIELYDVVQRLRFEYPEVAVVVLTSSKPGVFCAGANIGMLSQATHAHKVNFCKFTNETRNSMEDASTHSGQAYICALNGAASGGGYELAMACDHIVLLDDGSSSVSLPELPLLAVLPGTGGLTRLLDKRHVRRDHADFFCTTSEGIRGERARKWKLVDELVPRSKFENTVQERARAYVDLSDRPATDAEGVILKPLTRTSSGDEIVYTHLNLKLDRSKSLVLFTINGPEEKEPLDLKTLREGGASFWPLAIIRELDDAISHLRLNEEELGTWVFRSVGEADRVEAIDELLTNNADDWLVREITLYIKRTLRRIDVSARSLITLIEPGSCFAGTLFELVLAADRSYMLDGLPEEPGESYAAVRMTSMNFGPLSMNNRMTRLASRFYGEKRHLRLLESHKGDSLNAEAAENLGLVTFIPDYIDWEEEIRVALEERASFSPDALTGLEASLRFAGPETMETKIFGRLSAWQNWIFQRPNAVGEEGALTRYGTGRKSRFGKARV